MLKAAREKQQITHKGIPIRVTADLSTLHARREQQQITKGMPIRITADLSIETLQARREWQDILKVMKEKTYSQDYSTQQGSHSKLREFSTTNPSLQQMLKDLL